MLCALALNQSHQNPFMYCYINLTQSHSDLLDKKTHNVIYESATSRNFLYIIQIQAMIGFEYPKEQRTLGFKPDKNCLKLDKYYAFNIFLKSCNSHKFTPWTFGNQCYSIFVISILFG